MEWNHAASLCLYQETGLWVFPAASKLYWFAIVKVCLRSRFSRIFSKVLILITFLISKHIVHNVYSMRGSNVLELSVRVILHLDLPECKILSFWLILFSIYLRCEQIALHTHFKHLGKAWLLWQRDMKFWRHENVLYRKGQICIANI